MTCLKTVERKRARLESLGKTKMLYKQGDKVKIVDSCSGYNNEVTTIARQVDLTGYKLEIDNCNKVWNVLQLKLVEG